MIQTIESLVALWAPAAGTILIALAIGLAIDFVINRLLTARAKSRHWRVGLAVVQSMAGLITITALLIGIKIALVKVDLSAEATVLANRALAVASIIVMTAFAARIAGRMVTSYMSRENAKLPSSSIFVNLARALVWVIGGISVLAALGVSIAPLVTALGVGGLAVGLALQPTLENVFSGIQVLLSRQIEPGDFIQLETGQQGYVEDVTWRNTTVKLLSNDLVIVPNATIGKSLITNFTANDDQHVLWVPCPVAYDADLERIEALTLEIARGIQATHEFAIREHEPVLRYTAFAESAISMQVSLRADAYANRFAVRHDFIKALKAAFDAEGIEIPMVARLGAAPATP